MEYAREIKQESKNSRLEWGVTLWKQKHTLTMITKYFSKVVVKFNPFGKEAKIARLVLAAIPPAQRNMGTQIQSEIISDYNRVKPLVKVTYKDKKEMEVDPSSMSFQELANHFDRYSKRLDLKHMLEMH